MRIPASALLLVAACSGSGVSTTARDTFEDPAMNTSGVASSPGGDEAGDRRCRRRGRQ